MSKYCNKEIIKEKLLDIVKLNITDINLSEEYFSKGFINDFGIESMNLIKTIIDIEEEFEIEFDFFDEEIVDGISIQGILNILTRMDV